MYLVILQGMSVHLFFLSLKVGDIYSWYLPVSNVTRCKCSFFDEFTNKLFSFPASNAIPNGYIVTTENKNMFVRVTASRLKNLQRPRFSKIILIGHVMLTEISPKQRYEK